MTSLLNLFLLLAFLRWRMREGGNPCSAVITSLSQPQPPCVPLSLVLRSSHMQGSMRPRESARNANPAPAWTRICILPRFPGILRHDGV
jgi:hypothetical protein